MIHPPLFIKDLSLYFSQKVCFEGFSTEVYPEDRIALMGRNGAGKSSLLKIFQGLISPSEGSIRIPEGMTFGYVPQVIEEFEHLSGGQRLNEALTRALAKRPNVLLLDEPTNHLDLRNRRSLLRMLQGFSGTLIIASHDPELLRTCANKFWHIDNGRVQVFSGKYDDYLHEIGIKRTIIEQELATLNRQKKEIHQALMREQERAKHSRLQGEKHIGQKKWPTLVSASKARRAEETSGRKKSDLKLKKQALVDRLSDLCFPETITPKFSILTKKINFKTILSISEGECGYEQPLLRNLSLSLGSQDRVALAGDNGSGKTTLVKAILGDSRVIKAGRWTLSPRSEDIGYLDQHYSTLDPQKTVLEALSTLVPDWSHAELRRHLNDFLFRKNEEILSSVNTLSGGEKARLSLAQIAAKTPKLLILDEITNNLDLETRNHVLQVLQEFPGAMIVISHDEGFIKSLQINTIYVIKESSLRLIKGLG